MGEQVQRGAGQYKGKMKIQKEGIWITKAKKRRANSKKVVYCISEYLGSFSKSKKYDLF